MTVAARFPIAASIAAYDLVSAALLGSTVTRATYASARSLSGARWARLLALEGCAVQLHHAMRRRGDLAELALALRPTLRAAFDEAVQRALLVQQQLPEIATLARDGGIPLLALKGAARLLRGEMAGTRSISDIDLVARPDDAPRLHELLRRELGYEVAPGRSHARHHLAGLERPGCLGVEIHTRLSDRPLGLDDEIWRDAEVVSCGPAPVDVPSATSLLLHTLEHAVAVNWDHRYRLRDVTDVAALGTSGVDGDRVRRHVAASAHRRAMDTLLAAASVRWGDAGARSCALRAVRRTARTRLAAAMIPRRGAQAFRVFRYAGVLAEGSPRSLWRASWEIAWRGMAGA
jgi:hypothetical protein